MAETSPLGILLPVLPAVAAILKLLWPGERRGLAHRIRTLVELREKMPESGGGRDELDRALIPMAKQLAFLEDRRLKRHVDGPTVAAIVVMLTVGGALSYGLWQAEDVVWRVLAVLIATFTTLLVTIGGFSTIMKTEGAYPFDATPKPPRKSRRE